VVPSEVSCQSSHERKQQFVFPADWISERVPHPKILSKI
jgi:hypothetical protein